jgi:CubicO group peptidase (beta-lactamase class C family)
VVEVVSGMPNADFLQKRVLDPPRMNNTTFWLNAEQEQRFARNYRRGSQSGNLEEAAIAYLYGAP